ncbi:MAG TPA: heavy metal-binding domain-containing protein [Actinocrinis sp.]|uniref:heavy metal-binding domain-containing protein n=1 Tax=Actinocrinis sp. TaxID=1920516 RepID=UPI002DDD89CE|nr:heavy metal-binding domain-containing protein [Actinocrinis sp.]HEV2348039.1 heavy metal-binding domain-containing protein [Actinocrinis sp.]
MTEQWDRSLPEAARARMAGIRETHTWGSALSTQEFAAIEGAGFDPVGQVLGTAVYHIGYAGRYGCSGSWSYFGGTEVSSSSWAPFSELVRAMYTARWTALGRAVAECQALGGDGIVSVKLKVGHFPAGGLEVTALGTAVRARSSRVHPAKPFTSHVTGQEFGKLVHAGWIPTGLVLGISIATRHDDWRTRGQLSFMAGNQEVDGYTQLINQARHDARVQLQSDAKRQGGDGIVVDEMDLRIRERECPSYENQRDHIAEVVILGTSIARFDRSPGHAGPKPLTIMTLNRER